jgi:hypothetical protein
MVYPQSLRASTNLAAVYLLLQKKKGLSTAPWRCRFDQLLPNKTSEMWWK